VSGAESLSDHGAPQVTQTMLLSGATPVCHDARRSWEDGMAAGENPDEKPPYADDPRRRLRWFRASRRLPEGRLPSGLIGRATAHFRARKRDMALARVAADQNIAVQNVAVQNEAENLAVAPAPAWKPLGPFGIDAEVAGARSTVSGRITALAVGPGGVVVYAGSANGGVWRSDNAGASWAALDDIARSSANLAGSLEADTLSVGALLVQFGGGASPADDLVMIGTGEANSNLDAYFGVGIKTSTDSGRTFNLEAKNLASSEIYTIVRDPSDPAVFIAATTSGLYRRPRIGDVSTWDFVKHPDPTLVDSNGYPALDITDLAVSGVGAGRVYYAATRGQVWRSPDIYSAAANAVTWTPVPGIRATTPLFRKALAVAESDPSVVYCLSQSGGLFRLDSHTGGGFTVVSGVPKALFAAAEGGQGWYDLFVAVDPADADTVYLMGDLTAVSPDWALSFYKGKLTGAPGAYVFPFNRANDQTTPGDASTTDSVPLDPTWLGRGVHPDGHFIAFASGAGGGHDGSIVWIGCDGGAYRSTDAGAHFVSMNAGLATTQFNYLAMPPETADRLYGGCQDNGTVVYSKTEQPNWVQRGDGDGGGVAVDPLKSNQVIRQYVHTSLETSADSGVSWKYNGPVPNVPHKTFAELEMGGFYAPVRTCAASGKTLVAFGGYRLWFRSGWDAEWVTLPTGSNPYAVDPANDDQDALDNRAPVSALAFVSATTILAATGGYDPVRKSYVAGQMRRFDFAAGRWRLTSIPAIAGLATPAWIEITALAVEDNAKGSFYAALGSGGGEHIVYFDGAAWRSAGLAATVLDVPSHAVVLDPRNPNIVFLGTDIGVWRGEKSGGGWSWTPFSDGLPESAVTDLVIHPTQYVLRAATHGRGVWEYPLG